jgi:hypothetical protein
MDLLLIVIASDIFRSRDMGGWAGALWILFLVILPIRGSLIYLIAHGCSMTERQYDQAVRQERAFRSYVHDAAREIDKHGRRVREDRPASRLWRHHKRRVRRTEGQVAGLITVHRVVTP